MLIIPPHTSHLLQPLDIAIFGPLKKRLTAALSRLNQAQLARIQKYEWIEAYIQARQEIFNSQHIESSWRGAGLIPFSPQRALRTLAQETPLEVERPKTPTQFDIFDQVFVNSSPPNAIALQSANNLLNSTIQENGAINTPVRKYIKKLTVGTEQLQAKSITYQHDANNLRSVLKKRTTRKKGKRVILKGHFHISTQELCDAVIEAEKATKERAKKRAKKKAKAKAQESKTNEDTKEEPSNDSEQDTEDCIEVDIE